MPQGVDRIEAGGAARREEAEDHPDGGREKKGQQVDAGVEKIGNAHQAGERDRGGGREIGIRLAIGALEREVLLQFLTEAVVLASLGGIIGIALATAASIALAGLMSIPYLFDPGINLLSFLFSAAIGVIFGFFPARRAASLNPIDALRHE